VHNGMVFTTAALIGFVIASLHAGVHRLFIPFAEFRPTGSAMASLMLVFGLAVGILGAKWVGKRFSGFSKATFAVLLWLLHALIHDGIHLIYGAPLAFTEIGVPESGIVVAVTYGLAIYFFAYKVKN